MQKILIISTKNLSSNHFDGAQKRIFDIVLLSADKNHNDLLKQAKKFNDQKRYYFSRWTWNKNESSY